MFFLVVVIEECLDGLHDDASMLQAGDQGLARLAAGGFRSVKSPAWQVHSQESLATGEWKKGEEGRVTWEMFQGWLG